MKFLGLDRSLIRSCSEVTDTCYVYQVGAPIEVVAVRSLHKNEMLAKKLSTQVKDDSLMTRYCPTNKVYFSRDLIDDSEGDDFVSCHVDNAGCRLCVGSNEEFGQMSGVLTFSGYLSLNRLVEENKSILCTNKMRATIMSRVRIMALGLVGDNVFGLLYIPSIKGIKIAERGSSGYGISPITYKSEFCNGYQSFTIDNWFDDLTRIKEV